MLQVPGWLLLAYLIYAQGIPAFGYELGVSMGTQESAESISEVGAAFFYGFALGDLLTYIPILLVGLIGHMLSRQWGRMLFTAALGITLYWPVVCLRHHRVLVCDGNLPSIPRMCYDMTVPNKKRYFRLAAKNSHLNVLSEKENGMEWNGMRPASLKDIRDALDPGNWQDPHP